MSAMPTRVGSPTYSLAALSKSQHIFLSGRMVKSFALFVLLGGHFLAPHGAQLASERAKRKMRLAMRRAPSFLPTFFLALLLASPVFADDATICVKGTGDERISACTRIIALARRAGRSIPSAFYNRANAYYDDKGDYDRAIADYAQVIRLDPKHAFAYSYRGSAYRHKGEYDRALADFDQAIKLDPKSVYAYNNRGNVYFLKGEYDRAIADYDQVIRLDPKHAAAYNNRGNAYFDKRDYDRAIADYDQTIRLDPLYTAAYAGRGLAYEEKGDEARARADFIGALAVPQKDSNGKWAHDTARARLAALANRPPTSRDPQGTLAPQMSEPSISAAPSRVAADRRVALVIGNSAYSRFPAIPNPRNDAEDIGRTLKGLGFEVLLGIDLNRADMEEMLIRFARNLDKADTALVFYAGHGLQHNGINYLAPIDARIEDEADLRKLVNLQVVINDLQNAGRVRILIVDACRDNDVVQQIARRLSPTRSSAFSRGLARIDGADGTLVAFATQPNRVAADGDGRNSPFSQALLKHLPTPGLELRTLMTRVRADVVNITGGTQRPEVWDSLVGEFAFKVSP
jgi:tetratricopeptide (TPR) repeat protein